MFRNAVITAGGRIDGEFARLAGTSVKALVCIGETTLLSRVIAAARGVGIERLAVVGNDEVRAHCGADVECIVPDRGDGAQNIAAALRVWSSDEPLLYLTSDMPFIQAAYLKQFLDATQDADVSMPIIDAATYLARFPNAPAAGVQLGKDRVVNGGAFFFAPGSIPLVEPFAARVFQARKSPLKMAGLVGLPFALRFLSRRLDVSHIEAHAKRILALEVRAIRVDAPELAFDIDDVRTYEYACKQP